MSRSAACRTVVLYASFPLRGLIWFYRILRKSKSKILKLFSRSGLLLHNNNWLKRHLKWIKNVYFNQKKLSRATGIVSTGTGANGNAPRGRQFNIFVVVAIWHCILPIRMGRFFKNGKGVMKGRLNILLEVSEEERHLRALETSGKSQIKAKQIGRNWSVTQMRV